MNVHSLAQMLGLEPGTEISNAASIFLEQVKEYMQSAQANPSQSHARAEESVLTMLYKNFFGYAMEWAAQERKKTSGKANHENAAALKKKAAAALNDLQDNIIKYALAYMHLDRALGKVQNKIESYDKKTEAKDIKWTSDTGTLLKRNRKERKDLRDSNTRLSKGTKILETAAKDRSAFEQGIIKIYGEKVAEALLRPFRSALRVGDFPKAKKVVSALEKVKKKSMLGKKTDERSVKSVQKSGHGFIGTIEKEQDLLRAGDGKIFLKSSEVEIVVKAQKKEIEQKTKHIDKYHQPYLEGKLQSLRHLREKLLVVGSLESLTTLYIRLIRGMAQPLADIKAVRIYEEEVIGRVYYLLDGQFQEVDNIEKWNGEAMEEFEDSMKDFKIAG